MLFHAELDAGSTIFHDIFSYRLELPWRGAAAWTQALRALSAASPPLRTSLHWGGFAEAMQVVHIGATVPLEIDDLRSLPGKRRDEAIAAFLAAEKSNGFSL